MIRFFFRLLSAISLAIAAIFGILDSTRTVANSALTVTPLHDSWGSVSPQTLASVKASLEQGVHPIAWDPLALALLSLPGFAVFGLLALLLYGFGHRRVRASDRFAIET